jgi:hypothetical protein
MRLGLLGPCGGHERELETAARGLRERLGAERVVYLGADRALDLVVGRWAVDLVGGQGSDDTLMARATAVCLSAGAQSIDHFIRNEQAREELRMFESLPGSTTRSVELIAGKVAVLVHDKAYLEEEDILPASALVFGKSREPLLKQIGRRWFLSPGSLPDHGVMLLDDDSGELRASVFSGSLEPGESRILQAPKALRMRALGAN